MVSQHKKLFNLQPRVLTLAAPVAVESLQWPLLGHRSKPLIRQIISGLDENTGVINQDLQGHIPSQTGSGQKKQNPSLVPSHLFLQMWHFSSSKEFPFGYLYETQFS